MIVNEIGANWTQMMDAARMPMALLQTDLTLIHRNPACANDPVFSSLAPGALLRHATSDHFDGAGCRTEARRELIEDCVTHGDLVRVIGLGETLRHPRKSERP